MGVRSFLSETYVAGKSFVQGMAVTFSEMVFKEPITQLYPDVKDPKIPAWFRGIPLQKTNLDTGAYKCTACGLCVTACPVDVITLEHKTNPETKKKEVMRYAIDMSRCMLCNFCIEACPFDSLVMGQDYELAKVTPENMVYEFEDLLRMGLKYSKKEGPEYKFGATHKGTPPWIFAEFTGGSEADLPEGTYLGMHPPVEPKVVPTPTGPTAQEPAKPAAPKPPAVSQADSAGNPAPNTAEVKAATDSPDPEATEGGEGAQK